jgi:YVTN family beta-propeller protein
MRSRMLDFSRCGIALALAISTASFGHAQATPAQSLLILSKRNHTLSIVDPVTLKVVATAPVGPDPHEVIASSDGMTAYASIYGGGRYHTISVIDLVGQKALPDIDLGVLNAPHGLDFVGGKLWFTAEGAKVIGRYDPANQKVEWVMGTGQNRTHMIRVTEDLKHIYTTNVSSATVSVWEQVKQQMGPPPGARGPGGANGGPPPGMGGPPPGGPGGPGGEPRLEWSQTVVPVGKGDEGFDVSPDGRELWTADAQDGTVSIVDLASKKVTATLSANVASANRLKFTRDGKLVLISLLGGPDLVVLDAATHKEVKRFAIGHGAAGILIDPDGTRAFVACTPDNYVAVIDLKTMEVTGHIDAGGEPDGMAWAVRR